MTSVNNRLAAIETIVGAELPVIREILQGAVSGGGGSGLPAGDDWPASPAEGDVFCNLTSKAIGIWRGAPGRWYDITQHNAVIWQAHQSGVPYLYVGEASKVGAYIHKPAVNARLEAIQVSVYMNIARSGQVTFTFNINVGGSGEYQPTTETIIVPTAANNQWAVWSLTPNVSWGDIPIRVDVVSDNELGDDIVTFFISAKYRQAVG